MLLSEGITAYAVSAVVGQYTAAIELGDIVHLLFGGCDDLVLLFGDVHIEHAGGQRADGGIFESLRLDLIRKRERRGRPEGDIFQQAEEPSSGRSKSNRVSLIS